MPISKRWSQYKSLDLPNQIGVYELGYNKNIIYIGCGDVANRISRHDRKNWNFNHIRYQITNSRRRAKQRERAEQRNYKEKYGRLPKYNYRIG